MTHVAVRQGSPEWLLARRALVSATDIPVLLGLSPYRCEADLADEKLNGTLVEPSLRMRVGSAVQDLIGEEYTRKTGRRVRRYLGMVTHPTIEWAGASPDFRVVGERRIVEAKRSTSRSRFADGLPQDVEAQLQWQMGCTGIQRGDVAVLLGDDELVVYEREADARLFADLVAIADDFRSRLATGGPFARDAARIKRDYPTDNGAEMVADAEIDTQVRELARLRSTRKATEVEEEALESAVKSRMGEFAVLRGKGWKVTWKRTKDREETDWRSLATGLLTTIPETEREAIVGIHSSVRQGWRPFRLVFEKEDET